MSEQVSAELVPGGAIEMFEVRFFVVAAQDGKEGEPTERRERFEPVGVSAGAMQRLQRLQLTAIAKGLGNHIDSSMLPFLHFTGGEEQQLNRQPMVGQLPTQGVRFLKPRMAGQPFIRHGDQQIQIGSGRSLPRAREP